MRQHSNYQKKVIERYYGQRDQIMLTKLQEFVTELYLAESARKREQLWERVRTAMTHLKVKKGIVDHIMAKRDATILARNLQDWLKAAGR